MLQYEQRASIAREAVAASLLNFTRSDGSEYSPCTGNEEWARDFPAHFEELFVQGLQAPQDAVRIAQQGLQYLHSTVKYCNGSEEGALDLAIESHNASQTPATIHAQTILGKRAGGSSALDGLELERALEIAQSLVASKRADDSLVATLGRIIPHWCNLEDRTFVCINGLDDLAPTRELLRRGATVYLLDEREKIDQALLEFAENETCGKLIVPTAHHLVRNLPALAAWLLDELKKTHASTICNVQSKSLDWTLCVDAFMEYICNALPDTVVSHILTSHCNVHLASQDATRPGLRQVHERQIGGGRAPMGSAVQTQKHLGRLDSEQKTFVVENLIRRELGDEFALAQVVSQWRVILARQLGTYRWLTDKRKHKVSARVVVANNEKEAENLRKISTLLLIRDLRDPLAGPTIQLDNAYQLYLNAAIWG